MIRPIALLVSPAAFALSIATAPIAVARTLQDIYPDMVTANRQQPCSALVAPTWTCLTSTNDKFRLMTEVAPLIQAMPAPPKSSAESAQGILRMLQENANKWTASHCMGFPNAADKVTTCAG